MRRMRVRCSAAAAAAAFPGLQDLVDLRTRQMNAAGQRRVVEAFIAQHRREHVRVDFRRVLFVVSFEELWKLLN